MRENLNRTSIRLFAAIAVLSALMIGWAVIAQRASGDTPAGLAGELLELVPVTVPVPVVEAPAPVVVEPAPIADVPTEPWESLARCESGMRPWVRGRRYSGAFQFAAATWRSLGESGSAADYPYEYQRAVAMRLEARSGWHQWPACSRRLGLR